MKKLNFKKLIQIGLVFALLVLIFMPSSLIARTPEAKDDFDVNIRKRMPDGYIEVNPPYPNSNTIGLPPEPEDLVKINVGGPTDNLAPQLNTLIGSVSNPNPQFTNLYTVKQWSGGALGDDIKADYTGNWGTVLVALQAGDGEEVKVPQSGYTIDDQNHQVTVLYATESDVTLHYGTQDSIAVGYAIHLLDFNVSDELLAAYNENEANGRTTLLALPCGFVLGNVQGGSVKVAIRDTGSFIDPRIGKDWWDHAQITSTTCEGEMGFTEPGGEVLPNQRPLTDFLPDTIACDQTADPEFHPLRPYPANACDPLIPQSIPKALDREAPDYQKYITYSCGPQLQPVGTEAFDPYGDNGKYDGLKVTNAAGQQYDHTICDKDPNGLGVTCYRSSSFDLTADLKDANLGILGNTQTGNLTDEQKVNEYLSYYLTGVPQVAEPLIDASIEQIDRVINFSGPIRKLLPWDMQNSEARGTLATSPETVGKEVHDYKIEGEGYFGNTSQNLSKFDPSPPDMNSDEYKNDPQKYQDDLTAWRFGDPSIIPDIFGLDLVQAFRQIFNIQTINAKLFQNIPLSSVEDTAGEFILTMFGDSADENPNIGQHSANGKQTAPSELTIMSAEKASGEPGSITTLPSTYQNKTPEPGITSCSEELNIMPLGDSITVGTTFNDNADTYPGYRQFLYTALTSASYKFNLVGSSTQKYDPPATDDDHAGYGAQGTDFFLTRVTGFVKTVQPNIVLMDIGTNKLTFIGVEQNLQNMRQIITSAHAAAPNAKILLATINYTTYQAAVDQYNQGLADIANDSEFSSYVKLVPMTGIELMSDGAHPTANGYDSMAQKWLAGINSVCTK
ncbi:MAG: GDSL-type esterase/lipase family protein [Patescibacteria group bacterium]